jgi:hypothetical protein
MKRGAILLLLIIFNLFQIVLAQEYKLSNPANENALCLYNANSAISTDICNYYLQKRPGAIKLGLDIPSEAVYNNKEYSSSKDFRKYVIYPLMEHLNQNPSLDNKITHIAVAKDIPIMAIEGKIEISGSTLIMFPWNYSFSEAPLHFMAYSSTLKNKKNYIHFKPENFVNHSLPLDNTRDPIKNYTLRFATSYLTGYSLEDIKKVIDKSTGTSPNLNDVVWIYDADSDEFSVSHYTADYGKKTLLKEHIFENNIISDKTDNSIFSHSKKVIAYVGPGMYHKSYPFDWIVKSLNFEVANRAIITSYESFNGVTFNGDITHLGQGFSSYQGKIADSFDKKASGKDNYLGSFSAGIGNVREPMLAGIAEERLLFVAYLRGLTFAESYYHALNNFYANIAIGDPLMRINDKQGLPIMSLCDSNNECTTNYCSKDLVGTKRCKREQNNCLVYPINTIQNNILYLKLDSLNIGPGSEVNSGNSICSSSTEISSCVSGEWIKTICNKNQGCIQNELVASCKNHDEIMCERDYDCVQWGLKCKQNASKTNICVDDNLGFSCFYNSQISPLLSGGFACLNSTAKIRCSSMLWQEITPCLNGCSNGECNEEKTNNEFNLIKNARNYISLPLDFNSYKASEITKQINQNFTIYIHKNQEYLSLNNTQISQGQDFEIKPAQGFIIVPKNSDFKFIFSGSSFKSSQLINIRGKENLISVPYCPQSYNASIIINEIKMKDSSCDLISQGKKTIDFEKYKNITARGPFEYWTNNSQKKLEGGIINDFKIYPYESYWIYCGDYSSFDWTPVCDSKKLIPNEIYEKNNIRLEINYEFNLSIFYDNHFKVIETSKIIKPAVLENLKIIKNLNLEDSFIIINNLNIENKKIFLKKNNISSNAVCINDKEGLKTKQDILNNCILLSCPGKYDNYTCEDNIDYFFISGLTHSGVIEMRLENNTNFTNNESEFIINTTNITINNTINNLTNKYSNNGSLNNTDNRSTKIIDKKIKKDINPIFYIIPPIFIIFSALVAWLIHLYLKQENNKFLINQEI